MIGVSNIIDKMWYVYREDGWPAPAYYLWSDLEWHNTMAYFKTREEAEALLHKWRLKVSGNTYTQ